MGDTHSDGAIYATYGMVSDVRSDGEQFHSLISAKNVSGDPYSSSTSHNWFTQAPDTAASFIGTYLYREEIAVVPTPTAAILGFLGLSTAIAKLRGKQDMR